MSRARVIDRWQSTPLLLRVVLFMVTYFLVAVGGAPLAAVEGLATLWLPAGLAVGVLLISERRAWPWLMAAVIPAGTAFDVVHGTPVIASVGFNPTNAVQAGLAAWAVQRFAGSPVGWAALRPAIGFFLGAALVAPALGAIAGGWTSQAVFGGDFASAWQAWFLGDAIGILVMGPLILAWADHDAAPAVASRIESALTLVVTGVVGVLAFAAPDLRYGFFALLPLVHAGLRLRPPAAMSAVAVLAAVVVAQVAGGVGPFWGGAGETFGLVQTAQMFVGVGAVVTGLLVAQAAERRHSAQQQAALEREASRQRARLSLAVESAELGVWEWDMTTGAVRWSTRTEEIFGLSPGSFSGTMEEFTARVHPDDRERVAAAIQRSVDQRRQQYTVEHRVLRPGGALRWLEARGALVRDEHGEPVGMVGVVADITEQRNAQHRLLAHARRQEALAELSRRALENSPPDELLADAARLLGPAFRDGTASVYRLSPGADELERVAGGPPHRLDIDGGHVIAAALRGGEPLPVDDCRAAQPVVVPVAEGESDPGSAIAVAIPGREHPHGVVLVTAPEPHDFDADDSQALAAAANVIGSFLELHRAHAEQLASSKMEAVGRLAGGIAHDFNNLLTGIIGLAELTRGAVGDEVLARNLLDVEQLGRRAAALVEQLLTFSRGAATMASDVELNGAVRATVHLLDRIIGEDIELETVSAGRPVWVRIDPVQLEQVIVNLAVNAREAMASGGLLRIQVDVGEDGTGGREALLRVTDAGIGMPPEVSARATEPFFTTRAAEGGTGLGLATVYGIVQRAGGTLTIHSAPQRGTTVEIRLPAVEPSGEDQARSLPPARPGPAHGRVLVVEDVAVVREVITQVLADAGYEVSEATNGEDALTLLERERFDIMVTDVVMPRLGGPELIARIASEQPHLGVVVMSGYAESVDVDELPLRALYVQKPFSTREMLDAVAAVQER